MRVMWASFATEKSRRYLPQGGPRDIRSGSPSILASDLTG